MIEVFVAFSHDSDLDQLEKTLEAWDKPGMEPVAIEVKSKKFQLYRRVTAENVARADYILADLGYAPFEENFGEIAEKELAERKDVGIIGAWRTGQTARELPNTVVVCRKGIITHWPPPKTETYIQEHVEAYRFKNYKAFLCSQIHYCPLTVSLPC